MANIWWFLLLLIGSVSLLLFTLNRKNSRQVIGTYFFFSNLAFFLDIYVLLFTNSYEYRPNLFQDIWLDSIQGSSISQGLVIPTFGVIIAAFQLRYYWIASKIFFLMGIEEWFKSIHAYQQHEWKTIYTGLILAAAYPIGKMWWKVLSEPPHWVKLVTLFCASITITNLVTFYMIVLFSPYYFTLGWSDSPTRETVTGSTLFLVFQSFLTTFVVGKEWNMKSILLGVIIHLLAYWMLIKVQLLHLAPFWHIGYFSIMFILFLLLFRWVFKRIIE